MTKIKQLLSIFLRQSWHFFSFACLLFIYSIEKIYRFIIKLPIYPSFLVPKLSNLHPYYNQTIDFFDPPLQGNIRRLVLFDLVFRNLAVKKTRTLITIGGMSIGIATIVFLVSVGYGLERLVINRIARLDEMRQADISLQSGSKLKLNDQTLSELKEMSQVNQALPLIAVVGKVSFNDSNSDIVVYGVTSDYLKTSATKPIRGDIFESNQIVSTLPPKTGMVEGDTTDLQTNQSDSQPITFTINPDVWLRVRQDSHPDSKILGYTRRAEGSQQGQLLWGGYYPNSETDEYSISDPDGKLHSRWIKSKFYLWKSTQAGQYQPIFDEEGLPIQKEGYTAVLGVNLNQESSNVLGITTNSLGLDLVEIATESAQIQNPETKTVPLGSDAQKQVIVNRALLRILNLKESDALNSTISLSFVATGNLLEDSNSKIQSETSDYVIIGITPDEKTPIAYVPFIDLRSIGITNYSQIKLVVSSDDQLTKIRRQIEAMGYITNSVVDTIDQINSLFSNARLIFAVLGVVALAVAALGMFNTLTVSLLEKSREVGLMKAMGMKSSEVQELFLTESMIMGFYGGIFGIILGLLAGQLVGLLLSFFAITQGVGYIGISYLPFYFILFIIFLSLLVGIVTGIFPARRTTKISALNALRYE